MPSGETPISSNRSRRIFFPESHDRSLAQTLPTVFMIHGGGFTLGSPHDDDRWNKRFAEMHNVLVIELNYRKAPWYPFPTALRDIEALALATSDDESLPIDKDRVAIGGFSAGGNLTLALSSLASVLEKVRPRATLALYPVVDFTVPLQEKLASRYYKPSLGAGKRGENSDFLAAMGPFFDWSYIPVGQDLSDPLLSPFFGDRSRLPPHLFVLGAELDQLGHEDWRLACKLAGRDVPATTTKVGQEKPAEQEGLILDDERFSFEHVEEGGEKSVRWLLIPDQIHGFDILPPRMHGSPEALDDAHAKTLAYQKVLGEWLFDVAWRR